MKNSIKIADNGLSKCEHWHLYMNVFLWFYRLPREKPIWWYLTAAFYFWVLLFVIYINGKTTMRIIKPKSPTKYHGGKLTIKQQTRLFCGNIGLYFGDMQKRGHDMRLENQHVTACSLFQALRVARCADCVSMNKQPIQVSHACVAWVLLITSNRRACILGLRS